MLSRWTPPPPTPSSQSHDQSSSSSSLLNLETIETQKENEIDNNKMRLEEVKVVGRENNEENNDDHLKNEEMNISTNKEEHDDVVVNEMETSHQPDQNQQQNSKPLSFTVFRSKNGFLPVYTDFRFGFCER